MSEIPPVEQTQEALLEEFKNLKKEFRSTPGEQKAEFVQNNTERYMALSARRREFALHLVLGKLSPKDIELQESLRRKIKPVIETVFKNYGEYTPLTPEQVCQRAYFLPTPLFIEYANLVGFHRLVAGRIVDIASPDGSGIAVFKAKKFERALSEDGLPEQRRYELIHSLIHTLQKTPPCPLGLIENSADYFATKLMPDLKRLKYPFRRLFRKMTRCTGEESMKELVFGESTVEKVTDKLGERDKEWFLKQCSRLDVSYFSTYMWVIPPPKTVTEAFYENLLSRR